MKWHLSRNERWRPRLLAKRDAAAIVGQAFAAGIASFNRIRALKGTVPDASLDFTIAGLRAAENARAEAAWRIKRLTAAGCVIPSALAADFDYAPIIAARAVERVCADDPIPADWTIVDVERPFEEHGNARPDLVCRDETGALVIVDYKCKMAKPRFKAEADILAEYDRSAQLAHYLWAASAVYGESAEKALIVMVQIEPWKIVKHPVSFRSAAMKGWQDSAWTTWDRMSTPAFRPEQIWGACETRYGLCEFHAACWQHDLDRDLMAVGDYVRVERDAG